MYFKLIPIIPEYLTYSYKYETNQSRRFKSKDERITYLLAELNSTLDLYYEK